MPNDRSAQVCGCDEGAGHLCRQHQQAAHEALGFCNDTFTGKPVFLSGFTVKDSGKREHYKGGMVRDTAEGKTNWALVADGPMLQRWAVHLTKGAQKYAVRNWMLAEGDEEYNRARESAFRHFMQWFNGEVDEDHASAVFFNINEAEYIKAKSQSGNGNLADNTVDGRYRS